MHDLPRKAARNVGSLVMRLYMGIRKEVNALSVISALGQLYNHEMQMQSFVVQSVCMHYMDSLCRYIILHCVIIRYYIILYHIKVYFVYT